MSEVTRIRAGHLVDVVAGEVLADQLVTVRGERIDAVETVPAGSRWTSICRTTPFFPA